MLRKVPNIKLSEEAKDEEVLRPRRFEEFVGQKKIIENLSVAIKATKKRHEPLEHILFTGLPGLGKTTLALITSNEMGAPLIQSSGPMLKKPGDLVSMLTKLEEGSVVFIDEIHRISADVEEYLYSAMEDFVINIQVGEGPYAKALNLRLNKFTLIGATTREGLLSDAFRSRFGITEKLDFYPVDELKKIILRSAKILGVKVENEGVQIIAERARGTPRIANRYLRRIRDLAQVKSNNTISKDIAEEGFKMLGIDGNGLCEVDRNILRILIENNGEPVGLKTIAVAVGEEEDTIEEVYEPSLIRQGFLQKTPRGRRATEKAFEYFCCKKRDDDKQKKIF